MLHIAPYEQQLSGECGPAALKMVLSYFGIEKTEAELAALSGTTPQKGVEASGLIAAAEQLGFKGWYKDDASFDDIRTYVVDKKIPVIVDWFSNDEGHYSVAVDIDNINIHFLDPEFGKLRTMNLTTFYRVWFDFPGSFIASKDDLVLRRLIVLHPAP